MPDHPVSVHSPPPFDYDDSVYRAAAEAAKDQTHGHCRKCGRELPLEAHHWTKGPYPPPHLTTANDLTAFCRDCHDEAHDFRFFLDVGGAPEDYRKACSETVATILLRPEAVRRSLRCWSNDVRRRPPVTPGSARRTGLLRGEGPAGVGVLPAAWASGHGRPPCSQRSSSSPACRSSGKPGHFVGCVHRPFAGTRSTRLNQRGPPERSLPDRCSTVQCSGPSSKYASRPSHLGLATHKGHCAIVAIRTRKACYRSISRIPVASAADNPGARTLRRCSQSGFDTTNSTSGNDRRGMSSGFPRMRFRRSGTVT